MPAEDTLTKTIGKSSFGQISEKAVGYPDRLLFLTERWALRRHHVATAKPLPRLRPTPVGVIGQELACPSGMNVDHGHRSLTG
jgi:hypothetical protein